jgi:hypothetical protein
MRRTTRSMATWTGFRGQCEAHDDDARPLVFDAIVELYAANRPLLVAFVSPLAMREGFAQANEARTRP